MISKLRQMWAAFSTAYRTSYRLAGQGQGFRSATIAGAVEGQLAARRMEAGQE